MTQSTFKDIAMYTVTHTYNTLKILVGKTLAKELFHQSFTSPNINLWQQIHQSFPHQCWSNNNMALDFSDEL